MRKTKSAGDFRVCVIAGTHTVLMALDCKEQRRHGLLGFAFKREVAGAPGGAKWLRSLKVFKSVVPVPNDPLNDPDKPQKRYSTREHPIQSFLWGDYTAQPDTEYKFTIVPMYGAPGALQPDADIEFSIRTEKEFDQGHGIWFNRGAIAGQAFADKFKNVGPKPADNPDPGSATTKWLSRGLLEACLAYINDTPAGDGLRVAAYEFTYKPVIDALKAALDRGVDVRIAYHGTLGKNGADGANEKAIKASNLPNSFNGKKVLHPRTKTKIPHNKFIVRLKGNAEPIMVWTGSTNLTPSGFLGQTNVGHQIDDKAVAKQFLKYWEIVRKDPALADARAAATKLTPNPPALVGPKSITALFSPRAKSELLDWYADRVDNAVGTAMFTAAFGVTKQLVPCFIKDRDYLRFILMEKPPTADLKKQFAKDRDLIFSFGDILGQIARKKIKGFELDKWLLQEDHFRHDGFVFFVHTKFLLIDPLSNDPLICSGSANFSPNSLLQNDENMLLIRGDTRVADIYLTEFDRIFRHFYFRNVANQVAVKGANAEVAFLDETSKWTDSYFRPKAFKTRRREMFFADPTKSWVDNAGKPVPAVKTKTKTKAKKKTKVKVKAKAKRPASKKAAKKASAKRPARKK